MTERVKIYSNDGISLVVPEKKDAVVWYKGISNPEINQYMRPEVFGKVHSKKSGEEFYENMNSSKDKIFFGIYDDILMEVFNKDITK